MAPYPGTLAWKIPWTKEPGRLQSVGSLRVRHDWVTSLSLLTFMHWRRKWQPIPVFLPGESQGGEAWWAADYGVAQSQTWWRDLAAAGKTTRPFRYDLNQILNDFTVEVRNRIKGLDLIECLKNCGRKLITLCRRQGSRLSSRKRNAKRQNVCLRKPFK